VRNFFEKALRDLEAVGFVDLKGARVLDLGCGQTFPFALQCAVAGAEVTALDTEYVGADALPLALWKVVRHDGLKRSLKTGVRRLLFDRAYYRKLEAAAGRELRSRASKIRFVSADTQGFSYPLPEGGFDLVAANAVLEHVKDVGSTAAEVKRLLAPGGTFYAIIHNFYSLSGGHHPDWAYPDESPSQRVPPWDHLRENRFPAFVHLNRCRPEEYRAALGEHLDVLMFEGRGIDHDPGFEGETLLTEELARELAAYPRELLLTRCWCAICRKPGARNE
jgi:SAM-dependent methyltransferase